MARGETALHAARSAASSQPGPWLPDGSSASSAAPFRPTMQAAGFLSLVIEHRLVLGAPALETEELDLTSRLIEGRRVSGVWHHDVRRRDETLVAADRARGAFLDPAGRIRAAPSELLDDLIRGEPED